MKKIKITIPLKHNFKLKPTEIDAYQSAIPGLAIQRVFRYNYKDNLVDIGFWTITHIASGMCLISGTWILEKRQEAERVIGALQEGAPSMDWTILDPIEMYKIATKARVGFILRATINKIRKGD